MVLRFHSLTDAQSSALERMIAALPPVEWLSDDLGSPDELVLLRAVVDPARRG